MSVLKEFHIQQIQFPRAGEEWGKDYRHPVSYWVLQIQPVLLRDWFINLGDFWFQFPQAPIAKDHPVGLHKITLSVFLLKGTDNGINTGEFRRKSHFIVLQFWETSASNHKQVRHSRERHQWNKGLAETKSTGQDLISSLRVESMRKSQSRLEKQTRNRHVILTPRLARILQEQKPMIEGLSWCNQRLIREGTEWDGGARNTSEIVCDRPIHLRCASHTQSMPGGWVGSGHLSGILDFYRYVSTWECDLGKHT